MGEAVRCRDGLTNTTAENTSSKDSCRKTFHIQRIGLPFVKVGVTAIDVLERMASEIREASSDDLSSYGNSSLLNSLRGLG
jgi:hypothetical protein